MSIDPEIREDFSAIEAAHTAVEQRAQEQHEANLESQLAPARSQARLDEAQSEAAVLRAQGDRRLKTGGAAMAGLMGVASIIAAASLWQKVEVVHDVKIVEQTKVVEIPKIVTETKVIEKPVVTERVVQIPVAVPPPPSPPQPAKSDVMAPVPARIAPEREVATAAPPPPLPNPTPGQKMTPADFKRTEMFQTAEKCHGKLLSHIRGVYKFADGSECFDANADGSVNPSITSTKYNGDTVACNLTGRTYPNGNSERACYAVHNGRIADLREDQRRGVNVTGDAGDIFNDLFN
jgi:hypothetical protein